MKSRKSAHMHKGKKHKPSTSGKIHLILPLLFASLAVVGYWSYITVLKPQSPTSYSDQANQTKKRSPSPLPLAQGKQTYIIQTGTKTGPIMKSVIIDPFDPKNGQSQTFDVTIESDQPVTTVTLKLTTDSGSKTAQFTLKDGSTNHGTWTTSLVTTDTHQTLYQATIDATDATKTNTIDLTFR